MKDIAVGCCKSQKGRFHVFDMFFEKKKIVVENFFSNIQNDGLGTNRAHKKFEQSMSHIMGARVEKDRFSKKKK